MSFTDLTMAPAPAQRIAALEREIVLLKTALREAQDDGDKATTAAAQLAAALVEFGNHDKVALSHGSHDKCSCCFEEFPCLARKALDTWDKAKATT